MTHGNEPRRRRRQDSSRHPEPVDAEADDWLAGYRPSDDERPNWSFRAAVEEAPPRDEPSSRPDARSPRPEQPPRTPRRAREGEEAPPQPSRRARDTSSP
ncbi:MAG: hypothetical protein JXA67_21020, partial [Micromonosporaceae bacterium]|nr:hypothetical protein [Micromonosporaceae bacterium]